MSEPACVTLVSVTRQWNGTGGVRDVSLEVPRGSFVSILGPSGCGKSTLLRLIAGLETPEAGRILIDGRDVTHLPPADRGLSMVFQSYALFPHLNVRENILFGMKVRGIRRSEQEAALGRAVAMTGLEGLERRKPAELSGGQRQRVALARAVVSNRPLCLMDEPLSNLDAKLRQTVRRDIKTLQQQLGLTVIYVTHDQAEAMSLSDQVVSVRDDTLQRFTALRIEALVRPSAIPRRLNIVEGWMSFAFIIDTNRQLVGSIYDGQTWVMITGTTPLDTNRWSSVAFEYDGISIASLSLDGATVGSSVAMPLGMHQPRQVIAIGHWPRGDGRYTFMGDIGRVRIMRRDYEDFGRDALLTAYCGRKLTPAQASALRELQVLYDLLDERTKCELHDCARQQTLRLLELMRRWRKGNARDIARLRHLGEQLRAAWCCNIDAPHLAQLLLDDIRQRAGAHGSPERQQFEADYQEIVDLSRLCLRPHPILDRMRQLIASTAPDLAGSELAFAQLKALATSA